MRMQVRASGDEVHIELTGVAGRQQRVLHALATMNTFPPTDQDQAHTTEGAAIDPADVSVRAGSNDMRICLRGREGRRHDPQAVYRGLRRALIECAAPAAAAV